MKSRPIAGLAAVILALIGGVLIFAYAGRADARAMANMTPEDVLVVATAVPAGTAAESLGEYVTKKSIPRNAVASTALQDLAGTEGKVVAVDLVPGEQLLSERLVLPEDVHAGGSVAVPKGLQEVSFQLEPQRVVGGRIRAGDHVGVFISMADGALEDDLTKQTTQLVVHKALVTSVQRAPEPVVEDPEQAAQALPQGSLLMTVAVGDLDAQKIVFAAEFATMWLSKESVDAKESKPEVMQKTEVYR